MVGTYLSAARPRGCAQEHRLRGGADCAVRERRLPPASPALPRPAPAPPRRPPSSARGVRPAPPHGAARCPALTRGPRARARLQARLGPLQRMASGGTPGRAGAGPTAEDLQHGHATPPAPHSASGLRRAREFPQPAPSGSSNPCRPRPSTEPRTGARGGATDKLRGSPRPPGAGARTPTPRPGRACR